MASSSPRPAVAESNVLAEALVVRRPLYKLALFSFFLLAIGTVAWGFYGSIPMRVTGFGEIAANDEGFYALMSPASGQVEAVNVVHGQSVSEGDLLIRLRQPDLADQIDSLKVQIKTVMAELDLLRSSDSETLALRDQLRVLDSRRLAAQLDGAKAQVAFLEDQLSKQRGLVAQGYILRSTVNETEQALYSARVLRDQIQEDFKQQSLDDKQWRLQADMNEKVKTNQLVNLQEQLVVLDEQYKRNTEIRADRAGHVVAVNVVFGVAVNFGQSLVVLEDDDSGAYKFVLFVPVTANRPIDPGMRVDVEPTTVDHDQYGWLVGKVTKIDNFVFTSDQIRNTLQNDEMVTKVTASGPVYRVHVDLERDPSTASGYAWTSRRGPPYRINIGGVGKAYIHVEDQSPIDYLLPLVDKLTGFR